MSSGKWRPFCLGLNVLNVCRVGRTRYAAACIDFKLKKTIDTAHTIVPWPNYKLTVANDSYLRFDFDNKMKYSYSHNHQKGKW